MSFFFSRFCLLQIGVAASQSYEDPHSPHHLRDITGLFSFRTFAQHVGSIIWLRDRKKSEIVTVSLINRNRRNLFSCWSADNRESGSFSTRDRRMSQKDVIRHVTGGDRQSKAHVEYDHFSKTSSDVSKGCR